MLKIDFWNIAFTIINILVLYVFLKHFLIGPVKEILDARKEKIEQDLEAAAAAREEAGRLKDTYAASLKGAEKEAEQILETAREKARAEYDRLLSQAEADKARKLEQANRAIAQEQEKAINDLKSSVAELAMSAAVKILGQQSGEKLDQKLYQSFLAEAGDSHE